MNSETVINIATAAAIGSTAVTLTTTLIHFWRRHRISQRDAKYPHPGSRQPSLDPDHRQVPTEQEADEPDVESGVGLDPDRPPPPPISEADEPDPIEEEVHHA